MYNQLTTIVEDVNRKWFHCIGILGNGHATYCSHSWIWHVGLAADGVRHLTVALRSGTFATNRMEYHTFFFALPWDLVGH